MPRVSVVLTSFNHAPYVRQAIDSVLGQSYGDLELIIWDDASTDDSWAIIESYSDPRIKAFRNEEPLRAIAGVNRTIAEIARGEYIALQHSDDIWEPDKLSRQVAFLDEHRRIGAVFSDAMAIDEKGEALPEGDHFYANIFRQSNRSRFRWLNHFFYHGNALCHPSVLIRKRCYEECGLYRYGMAQLGDLDMWIRLCFRHEIHVLPEKLVRFRVFAGERNTSGSRRETRIRWITEFFHILQNYRRISSYREMLAIFPQAKQYHRKEGFEPLFVLAMIALAEHPFHVTKLFGIELLYELIWSDKAQRIKSIYDFDYRDLIVLTAKHDVFSHEYAAGLARSVAERDRRIEELGRALAESEAAAATLREQNAQREADLHHMHNEVAGRDGRIAEMNGVISNRDSQLAQMHEAVAGRDSAITERDTQLGRLHDTIGARDARIAELNAMIAQRDEQLNRATGALAQRDGRIVDLEDDLKAVAKKATVLAEALEQREARLAEAQEAARDMQAGLEAGARSLSESEAAVASLRKTVKEREGLIANLVQAMKERQKELDAAAHAVREREGERDRLQATLGQRDRDLRRVTDAAAERDREVAEFRQAVAQRDADLHHMHGAVAERDRRAAELAGHVAEREARLVRLEAARAKLEQRITELRHQVVAAEDTPATRLLFQRALRHVKVRRWRAELADCPLMDAKWYSEKYPDVAAAGVEPLSHYLAVGWREGREPGPGFDGAYYFSRYPDVAASTMPPLLHFWLHGRSDGRHPTHAAEVEHRNHRRWHRQVLRCPLFDGEWYRKEYPDVASYGSDPAWHYVVVGWRQDRQPGPEFDPAYYRSRSPELASYEGPPLLHYWRRSRFQGRSPNPSLDLAYQHQNSRLPGLDPDTPIELDAEALKARLTPFISVVIPTYNRVQRLPGIIDSWRRVAANTAFPFEIIFSDDGSTDGSVEYLESVKGIPLRVLRNEHGGPSRARNAAIRAATGERLFIVGDDIYPDSDILNVHAALAQRFGRLVATLGVVDWHPELPVSHLMHHITEIGNEQFSYNRLAHHTLADFRHFYTCNVCIDRSLVLEEGVIFDETFDRAAFEDVELAYRLSLRGLKVLYTAAARGTHYHPYGVEGFGRRQAGCGEMAVVFAKLHPAVEHILGLAEPARRARSGRRLPVPEEVWQQRLDLLNRRCVLYEDIVSALPAKAGWSVRASLSAIYVRLFRAMYEYGVLKRLGRCANPLAVAMTAHFDASWEPYWQSLAHATDLKVDFSKDALLEVAAALGGGPDRRAPRVSRHKALFDELSCIPPFELAAPPARAPTEPVAAVPALVVERDDPRRDEAIARFRRLFAAKGRVYERTGEGLLAPLQEDGAGTSPVPAALTEATAFHWPTSAAAMPLPDHLLGAFMAIAENGVELVVVSHALAEGASVVVGELRDHLVFSRDVADAFLRREIGKSSFSGRILRLLPAALGAAQKPLAELLGTDVEMRPDGSFATRSRGAPPAVRYLPGYLPAYPKRRPVVLVFPIFLAVGGVERNMVEILRRLNDRFDFVVVTMERLRPEQGSLAAQVLEVAVRVVEMAEIVPQAQYLRLLRAIKDAWRPDLVWVCNGSPWFCDNAAEIRRLFDGTPIVDQEVYDTEQGWINRYGEPGIRSFDYFVAINRKIERRFLEDFCIAPERTRLIYSAIDASRIRAFKSAAKDERMLRERLGIPKGKKVFSFVARLTEQKRPLLFLELAVRRRDRVDECFVLVGDGEVAGEALDFIKRHDLTNVVRIPNVDNTMELHQVSSGIVFTSAYEGLPIAMLEAIAMGLPVFATDVGDIADILAQYRCGSVVPAGATPEKLAAAFEEWSAQRAAFAENARRAESAVLERFSSETIARQYVDLWHAAMSEYTAVPA